MIKAYANYQGIREEVEVVNVYPGRVVVRALEGEPWRTGYRFLLAGPEMTNYADLPRDQVVISPETLRRWRNEEAQAEAQFAAEWDQAFNYQEEKAQ